MSDTWESEGGAVERTPCRPGINIKIGITHATDDLLRAVRRNAKPEVIQKQKDQVATAKALYQEHLSWCPDCKE